MPGKPFLVCIVAVVFAVIAPAQKAMSQVRPYFGARYGAVNPYGIAALQNAYRAAAFQRALSYAEFQTNSRALAAQNTIDTYYSNPYNVAASTQALWLHSYLQAVQTIPSQYPLAQQQYAQQLYAARLSNFLRWVYGVTGGTGDSSGGD